MPWTEPDAPPLSPAASMAPLTMLDRLTRRSSIRGIMLFILVVSLLPLVLLSTWQGVARLKRDREAEIRQLIDAAQMTSASERNVISGARALLGVLATARSVRSYDPERCRLVLTEVVKLYPAYSVVAIADSTGRIACRSDPPASHDAIADPALWNKLRNSGFLVTPPIWDAFERRRVMRAILPLQSETGAFDGVLTAAIDVAWLRRLLSEAHAGPDVVVALVDGTGHPVASSRPLPWPKLVIDPPEGRNVRDSVFTVHGSDGTRWSYAVAPLHIDTEGGSSFHIVYAVAQPKRFGAEWWFAAGYFMLPLLALLLASAAIWFGANRAILRWIGHLGTLAQRIGGPDGPDLKTRPRFVNAPSEIRDLAAELIVMGHTIADRDQRLRESVTAQTEVALELHHRVRNNLQVMGSFLSLQADTMPNDAARAALDAARLRVATMAMVNGILYADDEVASVGMATLLPPLVDLLAKHTGLEGDVCVDAGLAPRGVDVDRAVPIALWIVEAAACLFERARTGQNARFTIGMTGEDRAVCIVVSARGLVPDTRGASLHRRLVGQIARQLGGKSRIEDVGASAGKIVLCLPEDELAATTGSRLKPMAAR